MAICLKFIQILKPRFFFNSLALSVIVVLLLNSCSTKKNTLVNRNYHQLTTHYNVYFNGKEKFDLGIAKLETEFKEDYTKLLPMFVYGTPEQARSIYPEMDVTIEKCSKAIDRHSMEFKGKEVNKWIDNSYQLMGQAYFYKQDFGPAKEMFEFTAKQYPKSDSKYPALLWLTRSEIETRRYNEARKLLRLIENDNNFPPELMAEFHAVYTDYFLKQKQYDQAIPELEATLAITKRRKDKARMTFLLAQLYALKNEAAEANRLYAQVIKLRPGYEMEFYAKISMAMAYDRSAGGYSAIEKQLRDMLKEKKNEDYFDQIYYALGQLALKRNNIDEAIELFTTSTQVSTENTNQKGKSFLEIAKIYFEEKEYETSQRYYDSTASFLSPEHEEYAEVLKLKTSLTKLVFYLNTIAFEDSVQRLAQMSEAERDALIEEKIKQAKKEAERKRDEAFFESQEADLARQNQQQNANPFIGTGDNSWYFYNVQAVSFGKAEFEKIWGKRKNEDNWRRSNKVANGFDPIPGADLEALNDLPDERRRKKPATESELMSKEFYLKELPLTEEQMQASLENLHDAYYQLALVYKDMMDDIPKAIENFETLVNKFDTSKHHAAAYYQLFILGQKTGDPSLENKYKNRLLAEYPNSDYAKLIRNPNYLEEQAKMSEEVIVFYKRTLDYYQRGYYTQVVSSCSDSEKRFPGNHLASKFGFLKALASARGSNKEKVIADLQAFAKAYPGTDEAKEANEMAEILRNPPKIEAAPTESETVVDLKKFKYNLQTNHTFIVMVDEKKMSANAAKIALTNFNRAFFRTSPLNVNSVLFKDGLIMVSVKMFKDAEKAMDYYKAYTENKSELKELIDAKFDAFVISYDNYPDFYRNKNLEEYKGYFKAVYQEGQKPE